MQPVLPLPGLVQQALHGMALQYNAKFGLQHEASISNPTEAAEVDPTQYHRRTAHQTRLQIYCPEHSMPKHPEQHFPPHYSIWKRNVNECAGG
jgi:hypothetical protein